MGLDYIVYAQNKVFGLIFLGAVMSYSALFHDTNTHFKNLKQGKLHLKQEELLHHSQRIFIYFFVSR